MSCLNCGVQTGNVALNMTPSPEIYCGDKCYTIKNPGKKGYENCIVGKNNIVGNLSFPKSGGLHISNVSVSVGSNVHLNNSEYNDSKKGGVNIGGNVKLTP